LEVLLNKGPLPVNSIGHKVELTTGSITTAVDRVEGKNLVVRKNDAPEGLRLSKKMFAEHRKDMEKAAQALSSEERAVLIGLLKRLGKDNEV
jgi:MarR family 2-MHQ and catechol resistance regulon transcriptional repressor